jgi:hypothetical protein
MQHPQQAQFAPDPALPRGQGDLEALERLKETIKNNQHEIFRATPRLDALASLYQGPLRTILPPASLAATLRPEQLQSNPSEKAAAGTMSSGGSFETVTTSGFSAQVHSPVQGAPLTAGGQRAGISSNNMVRYLHFQTLCAFIPFSRTLDVSVPRGVGPPFSSGPNPQSAQWTYARDAFPSFLQVSFSRPRNGCQRRRNYPLRTELPASFAAWPRFCLCRQRPAVPARRSWKSATNSAADAYFS